MASLLKITLKPVFKMVAKLPLGNPHSPYEVEYMVTGIKPVCIIAPSFDLTYNRLLSQKRNEAVEKMNTMIETGEIVLIGSKTFDKEVCVYAQADKISEGKELYARYFNDDEGYDELEDSQWHKRIGKLLGYSDQDITLYERRGIYGHILDRTKQFRQKLRYSLEINQ